MMSGLSGVSSLRPRIISDEIPSTSAHCHHQRSFPHPDSRNRCSRHRLRAVHDTRHQDFSIFVGAKPPVPHDYKPGVVPGARTVATPLLNAQKVFDRLHDGVHDTARDHFGAFYSSDLGGVVTHPGFMLMHMDDHMVHRGHGVADCVRIVNGHLYRLPDHILRLISGAADVGIELAQSPETIMAIVLDTAAASKKMNGTVKVWLTAGRGGFGISNNECLEPGFFAMATDESLPTREGDGLKACVSQIPPKTASVAVFNTNNALPHVLAQMDAESSGYDVAVLVDDSNNVVSAANMNLGFISTDGKMVVPPPDNFAPSLAMSTLIDLLRFMDSDQAPDELKKISSIEVQDFTVSDMLAAKEVFGISSETGIRAITSIDGKPISGGGVGKTVPALQALLKADMDPDGGKSENHIRIPYR